MLSLLKILFITFCSILGGVTALYGGFSHPSALKDSNVLSWFLATAVVGLIVFSVPTAIAIGVASRIYKSGASWRARLSLCLCLFVLGGAFASSILYSVSQDSFSYYFVLAGCIGGLVGAFLIMVLKPYDT